MTDLNSFPYCHKCIFHIAVSTGVRCRHPKWSPIKYKYSYEFHLPLSTKNTGWKPIQRLKYAKSTIITNMLLSKCKLLGLKINAPR